MEVTFYLNKDCNMNCSYCNQKKMDKEHKKTDEQLLIDFEKWLDECIKYYKNIDLCLCGGEPGVWGINFLNNLFKIINKYSKNINSILMFTNGKLFNLGFEMGKVIDKVTYSWHCTDKIKDVILKKEYQRDVYSSAVVILTKNEIQYLDKFLKDNKEIGINIQLAQKSFYTEGVEDFTLEDYNEIIKILRNNKENISTFSILAINAIRNKLRIKGADDIRRTCNNQSGQLLIDLVEDRIYKCCSYMGYIPLTSENLFRKDELNKISCGDCINGIAYYMYGGSAKCQI
mgnify:CR=1 FL=1